MRLGHRGQAAAVLAVYSAIAWLWLAHGASLTSDILGMGADPDLIIWCLRYLPWAIAHHQFSFVTHLLWQPYGLNLAWVTLVPLLGLVMAPVTLVAGPVLSFNLLTLAAPALAGWAAYFLCLELGALPVAAALGGFIYGFSPYAAAQSFDHLNLSFTALVPLILQVVLRRVQGRAGRGATALWLGLLMGGEFLISAEILATLCLLGAIAFGLAYAVESARRSALRASALDIMLAAPLALLLASPMLLPMLQYTHELAHPSGWSALFAIDTLNIFIPTQSSLIGGQFFAPFAQHFTGALDEQGGYLGLPALLLCGLVLYDAQIRCSLWLPLSMLGLALLASLGSVLQFGGHITGIILPWTLIAHLPLLKAALPARCMLYVFLALAIIVSLALAARPRWSVLAYFICLSFLPAFHPTPPAPYAAFFRPGRVQQFLGPKPVLLILPFSIQGRSSFWQAENDFGFTQVGGYLGYPPEQAQRDKIVMQLFSYKKAQGFAAADFGAYARANGAQYVVAGPGADAAELAIIASLGWPKRQVDDVTIFTVPQS
jgi:hypothetical protein